MALPKTIARLDDVPEIAREHYADKDGVLTLTLMASEEHTGLVTALSDERRLRRDAEKQLVDLKTKFEGVDVDDYHKLQERVKGLDDSEIYDKQGIEALVSRRTESMKTDHERHTRAFERQIAQLKETVATTDRKWRQDRIQTALLDAVSTAGVEKRAIPDAINRGVSLFTDLDEEGNPVARHGEEVRYGKDGVHPLSPAEWIATLKASGEAPHLWPASSGGGAPAHHGGGVNGGIDYSKLPPAERMTLFREHQAAQNR